MRVEWPLAPEPTQTGSAGHMTAAIHASFVAAISQLVTFLSNTFANTMRRSGEPPSLAKRRYWPKQYGRTLPSKDGYCRALLCVNILRQ